MSTFKNQRLTDSLKNQRLTGGFSTLLNFTNGRASMVSNGLVKLVCMRIVSVARMINSKGSRRTQGLHSG